jgi:hypothetical protein
MNKVLSSIIYFYFLNCVLNYRYVLSDINNRQIIPFNAMKNNRVFSDNLANATIILSNVSNPSNASNAGSARILHKDLYLNRQSKFCHIKCDCFFSHSTKSKRYEPLKWSI